VVDQHYKYLKTLVVHRRSLLLCWALCLVLGLATCADRGEPPRQPRIDSAPGVRPGGSLPASDWFVDRAEESGLKFVHFNGMSGSFYYAEIIGPGVALFDYDNDGDLDLYLVQGQMLGTGKPLFPPPGPAPLIGRLFRNDLEVRADGTRTLRFTDVTAASGIKAAGYGMGAAAGDFNNDGCVDLYLTNLGSNQLLRNNCDGTFTDVLKASGTIEGGWSVSASFVDYDRDGWLDLFVGNYLSYRIGADMPCFSASGRPDYCSPNVYRPQPSHLYHNNRNGTFSDATVSSGMAREFGPALGIVAADVNGDGWPDLYVANDGQPNQLWINQRDGTFKNTSLLSGTAMNPHGKAKAGMGVDAGDFDNDGDEDLVVTNLKGEGNDLYVNDGSGLFEAQGERSGLGPGSLAYTGFGTAWFDADNDGWLDLLVVNGAVQTIEAERAANDPFPLHQPKLLFRGLGSGRFGDVTSRAGAALRLSEVSRGAAFGDVDNDGDTDVVIANNSGPVRLLMNDVGNRNHWIGLRLVSPTGRARSAATDMLGARVGVIREDNSILWRRARADGSYASANDPRVLVGLGQSSKSVRVRLVWPNGMTEEWTDVAIDRYTMLTQGTSR
jgi:enediyne biosynthesis protein E4